MRRVLFGLVVTVLVAFANWEISAILSEPGSAIPVSIATDSLCLPHVAFGLSGPGVLGYASGLGDSWRSVYVDSGGAVCDISLCLDRDDIPHIGYVLNRWPEPDEMRYACRAGDTWHIETVVARNVALSSLVLARDCAPHMVFVDSLRKVKYAYKAGDTWSILTVPAYQADSLRRQGGASLALDTSDRPGIAVTWYKYGQQHRDSIWLSFFEFDGRGWHRFDVDSAEGFGVWDFWACRVRSDPATDLFHVVYRFGAYATGKGNNWQVEEANVSVGNWWYDFALHQGQPHIVCSSSWDPLEYQWRWAGGWKTELVGYGSVDAVSIAVDWDGRPHITFTPFMGDTLFYARRLFVGTEEPAPTIVYPKLRLLVHPNPALGDFTVQYGVPVKGRVKLLLYDAHGKVKAVIRGEELNPGYYRQDIGRRAMSLPAGVYFMALVHDGDRVTVKVVLTE